MKLNVNNVLMCGIVLAVCFTSSSEAATEFVCQFGSRSLACPPGKTIEVKYANYGRIGHNVCYRGGYRTAADRINNCYDETHTDLVKMLCDGQNSCVLFATDELFGDTCPGVYKYLQVKYGCV